MADSSFDSLLLLTVFRKSGGYLADALEKNFYSPTSGTLPLSS